MVKPISAEPSSAACRGFLPISDMARDVLDHHDGVVDHEARRRCEASRERLSRLKPSAYMTPKVPISDTAPPGRDQRRAQAAQEDEDHGHDQEYREHQGRFDIMDRSADFGGSVTRAAQDR